MEKSFIPSLLIPEIYFHFKDNEGFTSKIIQEKALEGFYRSFEIGDIEDKVERKNILQSKEENTLTITQWLTFLIDKQNLDVSTINQEWRKHSVQKMKESLYLAAECGASNIAFVTGKDPGEALRNDAMKGLYESLIEICEEASKYKMEVLVEPLDRFAHKKRILGPTNEVVELLSKVSKEQPNVGLAFDTAHAALNEENIHEAMALSKEMLQQIHFSNAVLDKKDQLYGDNHMPIGKPGFLDVKEISDYLQTAVELGIKADGGLRIAVEVRGKDKEDYQLNEKQARKVLEEAFDLYKQNEI